MKNFIKKQFAITLMTTALFSSTGSPFVMLANVAEASSPTDIINVVGGNSGMQGFEDMTHTEADKNSDLPGISEVSSPILFGLDMFRMVVGPIAFIIVIIAAIKLISTSSDEEAGNAKLTLLMGVVGLITIQVAPFAVRQVFFGVNGDVAQNPALAENGITLIKGIVGLIEAFVGIAAVFVIIVRGITVMTSAGEEEALDKAKKHIMYAVFGLVAVALADVIVNEVVFPDRGASLPDIDKAKEIIVHLINFIISFVAIIAFAMLVYAGYQYVVSFGNEEATEKVKKIFISAIIALVLTLGAFALVNTVIKFDTPTQDVENQDAEALLTSNGLLTENYQNII